MSSEDKRLTLAMAEVDKAPKIPTRGGKMYTQVATRVEMMRKHFGLDLGIATEIVSIDAQVVIVKASITDKDGRVIATGYAEEVRTAKGVNSTSALENGETSAIGRALAALGLAGGEYASADELGQALHQQKQADAQAQQQSAEDQRRQALMEAVHANQASIDAIKVGLAEGDLSGAAESWFELDDATKQALWVAPSKGGPFTTKERETMKSSEFRQAYYGPQEKKAEEAA